MAAREASTSEPKMVLCCASCGKSDGKLKTCTACKSVKYCTVDCQRNHRKAHKKECKRIEQELAGEVSEESKASGAGKEEVGKEMKPIAKDICLEASEDGEDGEDLFKAPPAQDCHLCLLPLPVHINATEYRTCCGKIICGGCCMKDLAMSFTTRSDKQPRCPFCRAIAYPPNREVLDRVEQRMALGDPEAFNFMAGAYEGGNFGLAVDMKRSFELRRQAIDLGAADACAHLAGEYEQGVLVPRDIAKARYYLRLGAKRGSNMARHNLASLEARWFGNERDAVKHWVLLASLGCDASLKILKMAYENKKATKGQFEVALRTYQKAKEDAASFEREMSVKFEQAGQDPSVPYSATKNYLNLVESVNRLHVHCMSKKIDIF